MGFFKDNELERLSHNKSNSNDIVERATSNIDVISVAPSVNGGYIKIPEMNRSANYLNKGAYQHLQFLYLESVGASFDILSKLYRDNSWSNLAINTLTSIVTASKPLFKIKNSNGKKIEKARQYQTLFNHPNKNENRYQFIAKIVMSLAKFGNSYVFVQRKRGVGLVPNALFHIPTELIRVMPYINSVTKEMEFAYIQVNKITQNAERVFFDNEIIHFKMPNDESPVYGLAPAVPLFRDFTFDFEGKNWINSWFQNVFSAGLILKMENSSKEVVKRNRQMLKEKYEGARKAGKSMILEGDTGLVYDGNKIKDMDFVRLKSVARDDIMNVYGLGLSIANLRSDRGNSNAEVIDSEEKATLRNSVLKYQNIIQEEINHKFFYQMMNESDDIYFSFGANGTFTSKNAIELVKASSQYAGSTINENKEMLGQDTNDDPKLSKYLNEPLVATNNGVLSLPVLFNSFENGGQQNPDTTVTNAKQPTLKVNPEHKNVKIG